MSNFGGGEMLAVLLLALIVLGPERLPKVARQAGAIVRQLRQMSSGFQEELRTAFEDPQPTGSHSRTTTSSSAAADRRLSAVPDHPAPELADEVVARAEPEGPNEAEPQVEVETTEAVVAGDDPPAGGARATG